MSRWIDADVMIANALQDSERLYLESVAKHTPSIDIVRCKECRHWKQAPNTDNGWCDRLDGLLEPMWYCADGEREDER